MDLGGDLSFLQLRIHVRADISIENSISIRQIMVTKFGKQGNQEDLTQMKQFMRVLVMLLCQDHMRK